MTGELPYRQTVLAVIVALVTVGPQIRRDADRIARRESQQPPLMRASAGSAQKQQSDDVGKPGAVVH